MPYVSVDIDLSDIDTEDLIEELQTRRKEVEMEVQNELVRKIYEKRRNSQEYQKELDQLIYETVGKII